METAAAGYGGDKSIFAPLSQGKPIEWKYSTPRLVATLTKHLPSRRGNQLNGNLKVRLAKQVLIDGNLPSRRGNQLNGNIKQG